MSSPPSSFKAIIVGGGPVGFVTALGLTTAGVDFVVLERAAEIVPTSGAVIMLWPQTLRLLDQLGLYEAARAVGMPVRAKTDLLLNGKVCSVTTTLGEQEKKYGYPSLNFNRTQLIRMLYDGLPGRETRVRTGCKVVDVETDGKGVRVIMEDGRVEEGSIVIGCDGVHSRVREVMKRIAQQTSREEENSKEGEEEDDEKIVSHYQVLYGYAPYIEGLEKYTFFETRGTGITSQMCASDDWIHFGLHRALPEPMTARKTYSQEETEEYAAQFFDVTVMTGLKFRDLWPKCVWTRLVNQEEGFFLRWHHDRVVLVGDAVHKMTTNAGMGFNCGVQSAVVLINELSGVLVRNGDTAGAAAAAADAEEDIDVETLGAAFARYQEIRQAEARATHDVSTRVVRTVTWSSWLAWFMDQYFIPYFLGEKRMAGFFTSLITKTRVLDTMPKDKLKVGEVPWAY